MCVYTRIEVEQIIVDHWPRPTKIRIASVCPGQGSKASEETITTLSLTHDEIYDLARNVMLANGCDNDNAAALADILARAERDGAHAHGLFRVPGYVKALRSGKVNGCASRWRTTTR